MSDTELIASYTSGSADALTMLIHRYVDMVYAAASRLAGDPGMADDITQAVFIVLAKKANTLQTHHVIAGWLIVVTRQTARTAIRGRTRREHHERAAARPEVLSMTSRDCDLEELRGVLDRLLIRLRSSDRDAIALRYLRSLSFTDVGRALGISEEAARKRIARGIQHLQSALKREGTSFGPAGLSAALQAFAAPAAPPAVIQAVTSSTPSPQAIALSKGMMRMFQFQKSAVVFTFVCLMLAVAITVMAQKNQNNPVPGQDISHPPAEARVNAAVEIKSVAIQFAVSDVNTNIAFFNKLGFSKVWSDSSDADGSVQRASVRCGNVSIRLSHVPTPPHPSTDQCTYFYVDGGELALKALRASIADQGIKAGTIGVSGVALKQFDILTPDGYTLGFYSQP